MKHDYSPLVIHKDSPFKQRIESNIKTTLDERTGMVASEEVTIIRKRQYLPVPWVKLYQDKESLRDLSPWACKILIHVSLNITWNQERVKISRVALGMTKPIFKRTMLELLLKKIIANTGKREWYWVNVGVVIMGTINKHEDG